mmetsp:Transcript_36126/g.77037  ORF Transcript_36126/g.77037 Transcript_36126/m.77037 type:complete len:83 (-) Transcript_36126:1596-1844(-)
MQTRPSSGFKMHSTKPPLSDSCLPTTTAFLSLLPKYGPNEQCAEPVTGSSSIPTFGPKKRDRKSIAGVIEAQQQIITPLEYP